MSCAGYWKVNQQTGILYHGIIMTPFELPSRMCEFKYRHEHSNLLSSIMFDNFGFSVLNAKDDSIRSLSTERNFLVIREFYVTER